MKHKKGSKKKGGHRNARGIGPVARGGGGSAKARANNRNVALKNMGVAIVGGAVGAIAAGLAVTAGVKPQTAAVATLAGGAVGAYALKGPAKVAAIGAACAASGQLALAWQVKRQAEQAVKAEEQRKLVAGTSAPPPALPVAAGALTPKRNGYEDDASDDLRNGAFVDEYAPAEG